MWWKPNKPFFLFLQCFIEWLSNSTELIIFLIANPLPIILAKLWFLYIQTRPGPLLKHRNAPYDPAIHQIVCRESRSKGINNKFIHGGKMGTVVSLSSLLLFEIMYKQLTLLSAHVLSVHPLYPPLTGPNGEIKHSTLLLKGLKELSISDENHCLQTGWGLGWIRRFDLECWSLKFETWPEQTPGCFTLYQTPNSPLSQIERVFKLYFKHWWNGSTIIW
jgi:hypothetical protein